MRLILLRPRAEEGTRCEAVPTDAVGLILSALTRNPPECVVAGCAPLATTEEGVNTTRYTHTADRDPLRVVMDRTQTESLIKPRVLLGLEVIDNGKTIQVPALRDRRTKHSERLSIQQGRQGPVEKMQELRPALDGRARGCGTREQQGTGRGRNTRAARRFFYERDRCSQSRERCKHRGLRGRGQPACPKRRAELSLARKRSPSQCDPGRTRGEGRNWRIASCPTMGSGALSRQGSVHSHGAAGRVSKGGW